MLIKLKKDESIKSNGEKELEKSENNVKEDKEEQTSSEATQISALERHCRRFVNAFEDLIGFDTLFVFFILWFALLVEFINYKLFVIGKVF